MHPEKAGRLPHRRGAEVGRLEEDPRRRRGDRRVEAAHDARERDGLLGVGDDEVLRRESPLDAVERDESLPGPRPPHDDRGEPVRALRERVEVEGVQWLADVPEDVVRGVDRRR